MVWSKWKGAVALTVTGAGLAWGGFAWTQQPANPPPVVVPSDQVLTFQEDGKRPQQAVILKQWTQPDGTTAYQVQDIVTKEIQTIIDGAKAGSSSPIQQTGHTEDSRLTPVPADAKPLPVGPEMPPVSPAFAVGRVRTIQEAGKAPMKARILVSWRTPDGLQAAQCEVQDTGEKLTLVESGVAPAAAGGPEGAPKALAMRIIHWGDSPTSPAGAPVPPGEKTAQPEVGPPPTPVPGPNPLVAKVPSGSDACQCGPATACGCDPCVQVPCKPRILDRLLSLFSRQEPPMEIVTLPPEVKTTPPAAPPLPPETPPVKQATEYPSAGDWRKTWDANKSSSAEVSKAPEPLRITGQPPELPQLPPKTEPAKNDPLVAPEKFLSPKTDDRVGKSLPPLPQDPFANPMPAGSASVIAANNGAPGIQYVPVPVPVVTVPQRKAPPLPPIPEIPQAPQSNQFVNAFSPPPDPNAQQQQAPGMMPGYNPYAMRPPMMPSYPMPPQVAGMYPPPYAMNQPMPPAYNPRTGMPMGYMGPQAPNPVMQQPMPQYPMPYPQMAFNPAMDRRGPAPYNAAQAEMAANLYQMIGVLKNSLYPAQREWAANNLGMFDYRAYPDALMALVMAAREDPAPTVRAGCVLTLARMNAAVDPVVMTLQFLRNDADPRVRQEAQTALARFVPAGSPAMGQPPIMPTGGTR